MIDVFHKPCGTLIGRWVRAPQRGEVVRRIDFQLPDGARPEPGSKIGIECPHCERVASAGEWDWEGR